MKKIVISGINAKEGGVLSIMHDFLSELSKNYGLEYTLIALVHNKNLFQNIQNVQFIEFPKSKKRWFYRFYYEFIYFKNFSKKLNPYIWISLHDLSPNIYAEKKFVYCHNVAHYNKQKISDFLLSPTEYIFSYLYKYLYFINIKKNNWVIVQEELFKKFFLKNGIQNVIVARPEFADYKQFVEPNGLERLPEYTFFYPSFPRIYKNFEIVIKAAETLEKNGLNNFKILFTFDEKTNIYAKKIVQSAKHLKSVEFLGIMPREDVFQWYYTIDSLLFTSNIESWGLPISEIKHFEKPIILVDLPYARENISTYKKAVFFEKDNFLQLADIMEKMMQNKVIYKPNENHVFQKPYCKNWTELVHYIIKN